ncbi:HupE/UreJ family protein [Sphingorhabdus sp.]|uniref:HupE/UreJ family protein n=1 Tax=Sphingorhabdus sp. TaxID=1902408 RepID=UPI003BAEA256
MIRLFWLALASLFLLTRPAFADELRPGYLEFTQKTASDWTLVWKAPMRGGVTPATQPILPKGCSAKGDPQRAIGAMAVISTFQLVCIRPVAGSSIGLSNFSTAQTDVLVRVAPLNRPVQAMRLTAAEPMAEIVAKPDRWQVARTYFVIGIEHIVFGYDHLLFVVALVLLLTGFRTIAIAVTAFTVAHSITLVGTTLGFLGLPQRPVEAIIALSIIFLAVEIVKKKDGERRLSERVPWVVAFLFGLLHGFGFAGALKEIGLPESDVPTALLTFNLGVEAGQLLIVAATMLILHGLRRLQPSWTRPAIRLSSYAIGAIASMWLIERVLL